MTETLVQYYVSKWKKFNNIVLLTEIINNSKKNLNTARIVIGYTVCAIV